MNYKDRSYQFFSSRRAGSGPSPITRGALGWRLVAVEAIARKPLASIDVFLFDSGPGPLDGSVWFDEPDLRVVN